MRFRFLFFLVLMSSSSLVQALPLLFEPTDINVTNFNVVEIINSLSNSILECELIDYRLEHCMQKKVLGLIDPNLSAVPEIHNSTGLVYVTQKNSSDIYGFKINQDGHIAANTTAIKAEGLYLLSPYNSILEFRRYPYSSPRFPNMQQYYFSLVSKNNSGQFGRFVLIDLDNSSVKLKVRFISDDYFPAFVFLPDASHQQQIIAAAGQAGGSSTKDSLRYPLLGALIHDESGLINRNYIGGSRDRVQAVLQSNVASIDKIDGRYWITYKTKKKFTRIDDFPTGKAVAEDSYQAPDNANAILKKLPFTQDHKLINLDAAVFSDDNKIGLCSGFDDFICNDAFRYLDVLLLSNDSSPKPLTTLNSNSLGDHGSIIFRNVNYSPLNTSEVTNNIVIPEVLKDAFSGTCFGKSDFSAMESSDGSGNDTCTLDYDFRNLKNTPPINESFDVGFTVLGPFGEVSTRFHFNINLKTSIPHLRFRKDGKYLSQLNLNAGDSGHLDVTYVGDHGYIVLNMKFLNGGDNSSLLRSYFADTGCLADDSVTLASGDSCTLSYHIPANANNATYSLTLNNPDKVPASDSVMMLEVSSKGSVIAHSPYGNQNINNLTSIHDVDLQAGSQTLLRFTNVGATVAHHFTANFIQPKTHIPLVTSGSCTTQPDLDALGGFCDLTLMLDKSATINGRFQLQISADDIDGYSLPVTIGAFPHDQGLSVVDSHSNNLGEIELTQNSYGYLKITNYTGHQIDNFTITLPQIEGEGSSPIFYADDSNENPANCLSTSSGKQIDNISLKPLASCVIYYKVQSSPYIPEQTNSIKFSYTDNDFGVQKEEQQLIHFTGQSALQLTEPTSNNPIDAVTIDASKPKTTLIFKNTLGYQIKNLNVTASEEKYTSIISNNTCHNRTLDPEEFCTVDLLLNDDNPLIGSSSLKLNSDNLLASTVPLQVQHAQTDTVEIDNRGGYAMYVDYTGFYPNTSGHDSHCKTSSPCYSGASTGSFTNPFNGKIIGVSGRNIRMNMILGTSVVLPSCDGGKVICTGTTLNPSCQYVGDGTDDKLSSQNLCLKYNATK
ncbi:hypothetical protein D5018_08780 [Parashewanella curva]|uniref:IgGFc-binding protein N-terminal domain-containing protein n=1 Tax=Parashewanella curva TaxID=2338552 RepID=A0A3L8PZZ7_9GAMM|nr:hypothetical protein [Parashewanella curva]RLV60103.1 hypothetical protein D5018_08780 [Parashewanella curva]